MVSYNDNWTLVRFNKEARCFYDIEDDRFIKVYEDINTIFK